VRPEALQINGHPVAVGTFELADEAAIVDLDEPTVLRRERLRPSYVATGNRDRTQSDARALYDRHPDRPPCAGVDARGLVGQPHHLGRARMRYGCATCAS